MGGLELTLFEKKKARYTHTHPKLSVYRDHYSRGWEGQGAMVHGPFAPSFRKWHLYIKDVYMVC